MTYRTGPKDTWLIAAALTVVGMLVPISSANALETDQYSAWGRPLADAGASISAKFNLEIEQVLRETQARPGVTCDEIAQRLRSRLYFLIFQKIEVWMLNSELVPRLPDEAGEEIAWRRSNLYSRHSPLDVGTWVPNSPTVEVDGVRFGTDKFSHFVSSGWRYHLWRQRALAEGSDPAAAEEHAIRRGIFYERTILGGMTSGVFSPADLEANYQGMRFYHELCGGADPMLVIEDGRWKLKRPFDVTRYVSPEWDESYNVPIYSHSRWRKVQPVLRSYCERLDHPEVPARRAAYRARDTETPTERILGAMIAAGRIRDPRPFTLEANCPDSSAAQPPTTPADRLAPAPDPPSAQRLSEAIVAEQRHRSTRAFGLVGVGYAYPERAAGSVGLLFAELPTAADCHTLCDLRGPMVRARLGQGGGSVAVGWARLHGETGGNERVLSKVYLGYGFAAAALRTWGDPWHEPAGQTLIGAESRFTIVGVNFRLGVYRNVHGPDRGDPWLVAGGFGWGF
ncbi:MAG: hypothetical protein GY856_30875 [bacterium]|nr:hypothetical protein [bacterium]